MIRFDPPLPPLIRFDPPLPPLIRGGADGFQLALMGPIINKLINIIYKVFLTFFVSKLLERWY
ncbi:MAG: hypothetical protein EWV50_02750 [Microcystis aeruginosa Ma_MB_F_20061100_S20]|nr:MAG: hypothetical protein EWV50_02750 [Microcystis aeruginosa Ma_MB_F_20061100_S20]